jgi:hypothetical protein
MQQDFRFKSWEKKLEGILICIALCIFTSVCFDMYFWHFKINIPPFLLPLLNVLSIFFFVILGIDGIISGNLILRWTPYNWLLRSIMVNYLRITREKTHSILAKVSGISFIGIAILATYFLIKHVL